MQKSQNLNALLCVQNNKLTVHMDRKVSSIVDNMLISLQIDKDIFTFVPLLRTNSAVLPAFQDNVVTLPLNNAHWVTLFNLRG